MKILDRFNRFTMRWMPLITPSCLAAGIMLDPWLGGWIWLVPWLFAFMTFEGSLRSDFGDLGKVMQHPLPILTALLVLHVFMPLLAYSVGNIFYAGNSNIITGIVLEFIVPTGVTSLMWVSAYYGNAVLTLAIILLDTFLTPFSIPLTFKLLLHSTVAVDGFLMMKELLLMIALPAFLAMLINQYTRGRVEKTLAPVLAPYSKMAMILLVTLNSTKMAPFVKQLDWILLKITVTILVLAICGYVMGWLASGVLRLSHGDRMALTINGGMRNISTGAVIAVQYFPGEVMFPVMIGTLFQQILASLVSHLFEKSRQHNVN